MENWIFNLWEGIGLMEIPGPCKCCGGIGLAQIRVRSCVRWSETTVFDKETVPGIYLLVVLSLRFHRSVLFAWTGFLGCVLCTVHTFIVKLKKYIYIYIYIVEATNQIPFPKPTNRKKNSYLSQVVSTMELANRNPQSSRNGHRSYKPVTLQGHVCVRESY